MADPIKLSVVSQEGTAFERNVNYVNIPTPFGSVGVLSGHAPMLCAVAAGLLRCTFEEGGGARLRLGAGIASVENNEVTLLVASAEEVKE